MIAKNHLGRSVFGFLSLLVLFFEYYSTVLKIKELSITWIFWDPWLSKLGREDPVINESHQRRVADDSSCGMAIHGGNQWTPKKQNEKKK